MVQGATIYINPLGASSLSLRWYSAFSAMPPATSSIQAGAIMTPLGPIDGNLLPPEASRRMYSQSPLIAQLSAGTGMARLFANKPPTPSREEDAVKPLIRMRPADDENGGDVGNIFVELSPQVDARIGELDKLVGGGCKRAIIKHLSWVVGDAGERMDAEETQQEVERVLGNLLSLAKDWAEDGAMRVRETIMVDFRPIDAITAHSSKVRELVATFNPELSVDDVVMLLEDVTRSSNFAGTPQDLREEVKEWVDLLKTGHGTPIALSASAYLPELINEAFENEDDTSAADRIADELMDIARTTDDIRIQQACFRMLRDIFVFGDEKHLEIMDLSRRKMF